MLIVSIQTINLLGRELWNDLCVVSLFITVMRRSQIINIFLIMNKSNGETCLSLRPSDAIWHGRTWSSIVQVMRDDEPVPKSKGTYGQIDPQEQTNFSEISTKTRNMSFKKMIYKMSSAKLLAFCSSLNASDTPKRAYSNEMQLKMTRSLLIWQ